MMNNLLTLVFLISGCLTYAQESDLVLNKYTGESHLKASRSIVLQSGFHVPSGGNVVISVGGVPTLSSIPSVNQNYILTRTFKVAGVNSTTINTSRSVGEENQTIQYFDGLGRPIQTVDVMASPSYKDIVQHMEYDGFGRESKKYLPYVSSETRGSYKTGGSNNVISYYSQGGVTDIVRTSKPYAETVFENSPLNRVLQQGAPGEVWQPASSRSNSAGRTIATEYGTNVSTGDSVVRLWEINSNNIGAISSRNYGAGKLYKTIIKDENWVSGRGGTVEEYKDFEGRVVLKRIWESETKKLETYYVYDDFGDLRYVIPPGYPIAATGTVTITDNNALFNELIYAYKYDGRRRLIKKKIPGKGWEYFVYNNNDQVVFSRDSEQLNRGEWSFTKYDAFGRVTMTGVEGGYSGDNQEFLINTLATWTGSLWEDRGTIQEGYTNNTIPQGPNVTILTVNYYDNYANIPSLPFTDHSGYSSKLKTLLTASKTKVLGTNDWLWTVNHYDDRARLVNAQSTNHLGGTDIVTNTYSFVGELLTSKREHKASASSAVITLLTTNTYDHVGRLKDSKHKVNTQAEVTLAKNEYNEIGQLKSKSVGGDSNGTTPATTIEYAYNERGWTTQATSPNFSYELKYNTGTIPQYNGNISQQLWGHASTTPNTFNYSYDKLNRLAKGVSETGSIMYERMEYDERGNIIKLVHNGNSLSDTTAINYAYENNNLSNRLKSITKGSVTSNYTYDVNGNAKTDRTGMSFTYNHLNLPKTAHKSGTSVSYLYDAMGSKLRKTAIVDNVTSVRDYSLSNLFFNCTHELFRFSESVMLEV